MAEGNNSIKYSDLIQPDSSIEDLIKQLEDLRKTYVKALQDIKKEAIQLSAQLQSVSGAMQQGQRTIRETVADTNRLTQSQSNLQNSMSQSGVELARLRNAQREQNTINRATARLNEATEGSYNALSAQYTLNSIRLNSLTRDMRENTEEGRRLTQQTRELRNEMQQIQADRGNMSLNVGNYTDAVREALGTLQNEFASSLMNLRTGGEGITGVFQSMGASITAFGQTLLGLLTNPAFIAIAGVAGVAGAFKWWYNYNQGLIEATRLTKQFTNLSGNDLKAFRSEVQATADMFGKDFKEVMIASNAVAKQFGISQQEAIKLVQDGFVAGGDANGEYLDSLKEYPAYFKEAGLSASQFIAITTNGAKAGIFSDKAPDTIKELNDRLREMPKATAEALQAIGMDYIQIQKDLQDGTKTTFTVAQEVAEKLKELPESSALTGQVLANVFGEVGKDAGLEFIKTLTTMELDLQKVKAESGELGQAQDDLLKSNLELANVTSALFDQTGGTFETLIAKGKTLANDVLISIIKGIINIVNWTIKIYNGNMLVKGSIQGLIVIFKTLWEVTSFVFRFIADGAKVIGDILAGIFAFDPKSIMAGFETFGRSMISNTKKFYRETKKAVKDGVKAIGEEASLIKIPMLNSSISTPGRPNIGPKKPAKVADYTKPEKEKKEKEEKETDPATIYKKNLDLQRKYQDAVLSLEKDGFKKREKEINFAYDRQKEDLQLQLKTEKDLTKAGVEAINGLILNLQKVKDNDLDKLEKERNIALLEQQKNGIQLRLDAAKKGSDAEYQLKLDLLAKEQELELAQNKAKPESEQRSETEIKAKFAVNKSAIDDEFLQLSMTRFDHLQALEQSEFDLLYNSEEKKTKFKLEQEKKRLQKILELNKLMGNKLSDTEVSNIQKTIQKVDKEISDGQKGKKDIYSLFGLNLDDKAKEAINESVSFVLDQVRNILAAKVEAADQAVQAADKEVDSSQKLLDAELEARANGYANNVLMAQKELDVAKKNQEKANKEKEKAVREQEALDTITQTSSLITASANIWSSLSAIPVVGTALAIAALGLMWGSFAASKIKARSITKSAGTESYGDGTVELLNGGSHQSGNDVDLGTKSDGTKRRAEGGEFFAVINKRSSRRYRKVIPDVIKSFNNGSFAQKYLGAYDGAKNISVNMESGNLDFAQIKDDVSEIRNRKRYITDGDGNTIEIYKNLKRIIRK